MNEKLNNIFVTLEVARLAKGKGFNEWCACWSFDNGSNYAPVCDYFTWNFNSNNNNTTSTLKIPTHFQLIEWLRLNYQIDVRMRSNGFWIVYDEGEIFYTDNSDSEFEINNALTHALNLIET